MKIDVIRSRFPNLDLYNPREVFSSAGKHGIMVLNNIHDAVHRYELGLQRIISTGVTFNKLMQKLGEVDVCFITAYLTGKDPDRGGYGIYKEEQQGRTGVIHKEGEMVTRDENRFRNKDLSSLLRSAGYGWVTAKGFYDSKPEKTYIVFNPVESQSQFVEDMKIIADICGQDSIVLWLKGGVPYLYYPKTSKKRLATEAEIREVLGDDNYTKYQGRKFNIPFPFDDSEDDQFLIDAVFHYPITYGRERQIVVNWRNKYRSLYQSMEFVSYDDLVSEFAQYCINENIIPPSYADVMKWYKINAIYPDSSNTHSIYKFIQDTITKIINH